ncbi:tetraspanin-33-like [Ylistrum balloti]|uniref:tetraspanin-33-like n=1 Tax=Ylistrum balloti TaxID=509963 RepID=UPI0029058A55|nr:tetraspanin-33-like [Ylistrum balloti]
MGRRRDKTAVNPLTKYFLFFENFIIWIGGLAITGLGAYVLWVKQKVVKDAFDFFLDPATIMVTAGSIVVFISFFGCMGALRENMCFLKTYNIILSIMFFGELALVIFVFVFYFVPDAREQLGLFPGDSMRNAIQKYGIVDDEDMVNLIDNIQKTLHCCGLSDNEDGYKDWNNNEYFNCTVSGLSPEKCSVPPSCCKLKPGEYINILCGRGVMKPTEAGGSLTLVETDKTLGIYKVGCLRALGEWINDNALVLGGIILGILIPQIFIMCLARSLRDQIKLQKLKWRRYRPSNDDHFSK